jgi:uncharacterized protein (DUF1778 family)
MRKERIQIRTSAEAKAVLAKAARAQNLSLTQFVLQASLAASERIVPPPDPIPQIRVGSTTYDWLMRMLASPTQNLAALGGLLNESTEWIEDEGLDD